MIFAEVRKKYIIANVLLLVACAAAVSAYLFSQDGKRPDMRGPSFGRYLLNSGLETQHFTTSDEKSWVPNDELYDPFPDVLGFQKIPPDFLRAVRRYEKSCSPRDFNSADQIARLYSISPAKLLEWHRVVCSKHFKDFALWLDRTPYIHPTGVSYAKLHATASSESPHGETYFHIREKTNLSDFDRWYLALTADEQAIYRAPINPIVSIGNQIAVGSDWTGTTRDIYIYPLSAINEDLRENYSMEVLPRAQAKHCDFQHYALCFSKLVSPGIQWKKRWTVPTLFGVVAFLFLSLLFSFLDWRRQYRLRNADQALLFQVISHEIRTPLTGLKLSTDGLRQQFDSLDPKSQQHFMKLLDGFYDLEVIVSRTLKELKGENFAGKLDLVEMSQALIDSKYKDVVSFSSNVPAATVRMSDFWFEICLTNLIRNALLHGKAPVTVSVKRDGRTACVEVQDAGFISLWKMTSFQRPFSRRKSTRGLGIGLTIVARKMREVGGKLIARNEPTRYILQFNVLEENETPASR